MAILTPKDRAEEVKSDALYEGMVNGAMIMFPGMGMLYAALQNKKFVKYTNWQSRTALVIMPSLFIFVVTSEKKMLHRMEQVAEETEHTIKSVEWADQHHRRRGLLEAGSSAAKKQDELRALYRHAVMNSGVRVVESSELTSSHNAANFIQANPFKLIIGIGAPAVAYIFYGRSGKEHLSFQMQLLHTRVFGQFAVICTLLGVMGLKDMMDRHGKFITEADVEERVLQMEDTRNDLLDRLDYQAKQKQQQQHQHQKWE